MAIYPKKKKVVKAESGLSFDTSSLTKPIYDGAMQRSSNRIANHKSPTKPAGSGGKSGGGPGIAAIAGWAGQVGDAASTIAPDATAKYNRASGSDKKVDKLLPMAKKLPIVGGFVRGAAGISETVRGDGKNGLRNFAGDSLGGANTVKSIVTGRWKEAIPIYGGFTKAQRIRKESNRLAVIDNRAEAEHRQKQSNAMFGVQTYEKGGTVEYEDDGKKAVILGGKLHKDGGNPIVKAGEKVAETEREELMFTRNQALKVENHVKAFDSSKDEAELIALGKCVAEIILTQTKDNSGKYEHISKK